MLSLSIYRKWTSTNLQLGGISCSANSYYEKNIATGSVRCIDDEIPFDIPQGWEWCRFRSICKQLTDGTHNTPHYVDEGVPFISVKDMSSGRISFSNTRYISFEEHEILSARCNPEKGDLLLSKVGTTGIPALISDNRPFSIFVSLALIKFFNDEIETDYLIHLINSPLVQEQAKTNTRGVGNKNWVLSAISNTLIVIPPKNQQISIIEFLKGIESKLNSCDKLIENFERLNSKIKDKLSQSILQEAIQGSLVPQIESEGTAEDLLAEIRAEKQRLVKEGKLKKSVLVNESRIFRGDDNKYREKIGNKEPELVEELPFEIPSSWVWIRLGELFDHNTGKALNGKGTGTHLLKYLTTSNLYWDRFDFTKVKEMYFSENEIEKCSIRNGDLLVCEGGDIGRAAIWSFDYEICIQNHIHRLRPFIKIDVRFYLYILMYYKAIGMIGGRGIGIQGLSSKALHDIIIPVPPRDEQARIVKFLDKTLASIMSR